MSTIISYQQIYQELASNLSENVSPAVAHVFLRRLLDKVKEAADLTSRKFPSWRDLDKPIMAIDFDGCLCTQEHGWEGMGVIRGTPVPNAFRYLFEALEHFHVMIFSTRCNSTEGIIAMQAWFLKHGLGLENISRLHFEPGKPSFFVYIDDRALHFMGDWNALAPPKYLYEHFRPWDYKHGGWKHAQEMSKVAANAAPIAASVDSGEVGESQAES